MTETRNVDTTEDEELVLDLLEDNPLRIEEVAAETGMDYDQAQRTIQDLWDRSLVVSGPDFGFETDREVPPNLQE